MQLKYRAIVIDDMEFCRDILREFLEERGYEVITLADVTSCPLFLADAAGCRTTATCADLLLIDNRMLPMSGIEFLETLQKSPCRLKFYGRAVFSANWRHEDLERAQELGCEIFHKPYDFEKLSSWLAKRESEIPQDRELADIGSILNKDATS